MMIYDTVAIDMRQGCRYYSSFCCSLSPNASAKELMKLVHVPPQRCRKYCVCGFDSQFNNLTHKRHGND